MKLKAQLKRILDPRVGIIGTITNQDRKIGESLTYESVWVIDETGKKKCLLFTENEIRNAEKRSEKNSEDI